MNDREMLAKLMCAAPSFPHISAQLEGRWYQILHLPSEDNSIAKCTRSTYTYTGSQNSVYVIPLYDCLTHQTFSQYAKYLREPVVTCHHLFCRGLPRGGDGGTERRRRGGDKDRGAG